jgi:hypothetical protein
LAWWLEALLLRRDATDVYRPDVDVDLQQTDPEEGKPEQHAQYGKHARGIAPTTQDPTSEVQQAVPLIVPLIVPRRPKLSTGKDHFVWITSRNRPPSGVRVLVVVRCWSRSVPRPYGHYVVLSVENA